MEARTECDVADVIARFESFDMSNLQRRFSIRIHDLRRGLTTGSSSRVDKLLQKDLAEDAVRFFFKEGREDDGYSIRERENVDCFFRSAYRTAGQ